MDFSRCFVGSSTKKTRHPFFWWPLCFLDLARLQQLHQIQNLGTWWDVVSGNISLGGLIWLSSAWTTWAWGMMYCPSLTMKGWLWMIAAKMICSVLWTHHVPHTFLFPFWIEVHSSKMPIVSATGKRTSMWPYDPASFVRTINSCQMVLYALLQRIICSNHTWSSVVDSTLSCIDSKGRWLVLSNIDIFYVNTTILRLPKIFSWVTKVQGGGIP